MSEAMTGAQIVLKALQDQGVEHIFGYPGGAVLPIYDEIFQQDAVEHILVRHEQGATHAAEGYARSTGKPGVVLVTSGPGATNAVTGLTDALMDSIPMVCITGQVATHLIGNDAFQEADTVGITRPCTKHNYLVKSADDLPRILHEAFHVATTGRPGPVVVDIPKDAKHPKEPNQQISLALLERQRESATIDWIRLKPREQEAETLSKKPKTAPKQRKETVPPPPRTWKDAAALGQPDEVRCPKKADVTAAAQGPERVHVDIRGVLQRRLCRQKRGLRLRGLGS